MRRCQRRSFAGCRNCRHSKVKCDETRPHCERCLRLNRICDYTPLPRKKYTRRIVTQTTEDGTGDHNGQENISNGNGSDVSTSNIHSTATSNGVVTSHSTEDSRNDNTVSPDGPIEAASSWNSQDSYNASSGSPNCMPNSSSIAAELSPECLDILSDCDYSAIHFFRTVLPQEGDTRWPEYSGPGMVWILARQSPMVLHMVCSLAGQRWIELNGLSSEIATRRTVAIEHYGAGLRLLYASTQATGKDMHLENVLATLFLMIQYELRFGDGCGVGFETHLQGASIITLCLCNLGDDSHLNESQRQSGDEAEAFTVPDWCVGLGQKRLSPVSSQIIVWMALIDGGAALNGFGGAFNRLLGQAIHIANCENPIRARLKLLRALQKCSSLVNWEIWAQSYPHEFLIEDLQNNHVHCMYAELGQLRFLLGTLHANERAIDGPDTSSRKALANGIAMVKERYDEVIRAAMHLELPQSTSSRNFVVLVRFIVPFYHAVNLIFLRIIHGNAHTNLHQRDAIKQIMSLAFRAFRDQGQIIMSRLAWPLFVVALESDDVLHRNWILERYDELMHRGENFTRAREALHIAFGEQTMEERRISYFELFLRGDVKRFLL